MSPRSIRVPKILTLAFVGLCLSTSNGLYGQGGPGQMPPPLVTFVEVSPTTVPVAYELVGVVQPSRTIEVRSRVKGFISERLFQEGAKVKEGDLLFRIDPRTFQADLDVAQARVEQAQSREQLARREEERLKSLVARSLVSQSDYDRAAEELLAARAAMRLSQAELKKSQLELSFTEIKSPQTGVIGKALYDKGSFVDDVNNSLLSSVQKLDPIHVICGVSEREYLLFQEDLRTGRLVMPAGQKMRLQVQPANGKLYESEGQVDFEEPGFSMQSGISQVRGLFPNPENVLRPGQFVKVKIIGYLKPDAVIVPQRAVNMSPLGAAVFVIGGENKLEPRPITPGKMAGENWIIEKGLNTGDRVMVDGLMKTQGPGSAVNPAKLGSPEANAVAPPPGMPGMGGPPAGGDGGGKDAKAKDDGQKK